MAVMTRKSRSLDMTEGPVAKNFVTFAVPLVLTNLLQQFYNIADSMIIGKFSTSNALAAVGLCGSIVGLFLAIFNGLAGGASVVAAQKFGAKDHEGLSKAVHTSYMLAIISGVILMVVGLSCSRLFLKLMSTPQEIVEDCVRYMTYIYIGIIPSMIYNFGAGILRSVGDSKNPLIFLVVAAVVNISLNLVFVAGFGMGVDGVGLSTLISQIITAVMVTLVLLRAKDACRLEVKKLKIDKKCTFDILKIGIPSGIQGAMFSVSNVIIKTYVNGFGVVATAADAVEGNVSNICFAVTAALSSATITFAGQNYGKKQYSRVYKGGYKCAGITFAVIATLSAIAIIFSAKLPYLFTSDAEVAQLAQVKMIILLIVVGLYAVSENLSSTVRACGSSFIPMVLSILLICGARMLWCVIGLRINHTIEMVYLSYPISYILYFFAILIYYTVFKRYWLKGM